MKNGADFMVAVLLVSLTSMIAAAQNLATNPGFETGDTTGWMPFGTPTISTSTAQVHSGTYACLVTNRSATYMGVAQSFLGVMQPNLTYNVSIWLRMADGPDRAMYITAQKIDASGTTYNNIATSTVSSGRWTQISGQYTLSISGTLTNLTIYFEVPSSSTNAYFADDFSVTPVSAAGSDGACVVDWAGVFQRIDGFGASSAWVGGWTTSQANMFFSTNSGTGVSIDGRTNFAFTGVGLSLLRNHVTFASSTGATAIPGTGEISIMRDAQALGARVWSTPWTPPAGFKSINDIYDIKKATGGGINGGSYLGSGNNITNLNYASQLANYVSSMKNTYGLNIYAFSIQNEPDAQVTNYEACQWTGQQFHDFVTNLHAAFLAKGVGSTRIILPESQNWASNPGLYTPTLNDANTAAVVDIIANHNYVGNNVTGDTSTPARLSTSGLSSWETEVSQIGGSYDASIRNAVYWAGRIHLFMTAAQANAWHYWWLVPLNSDNEGLTDRNGVPAKRMYALGQFSRFVRPNFYRISVANNTGTAQVSAYKDSASPAFAIVAINSTSATVTQMFNLTNVLNVSSVTPWLTTSNLNLAVQPAVTVSNLSFSYALPAMSIATFVGQSGGNTPPIFAGVSNQTADCDVMLIVTNTVTDANSPPPPLSFNLLDGPANSSLSVINGTNAVFKWRPLVNQANSTNNVTIEVKDSSAPGLSATNRFSVIVNPLSPLPTVSSINVTGGKTAVVVNGPAGPDYTLLTSTNLNAPEGGWQVVLTTNSPAPPVTLLDTNSSDAWRFYRIQIGP